MDVATCSTSEKDDELLSGNFIMIIMQLCTYLIYLLPVYLIAIFRRIVLYYSTFFVYRAL